jgi:hypothetical protein
MLACGAVRKMARAYPLLMESKAGSKFLFYRASLSENRFTLFRTHSGGGIVSRPAGGLRRTLKLNFLRGWAGGKGAVA